MELPALALADRDLDALLARACDQGLLTPEVAQCLRELNRREQSAQSWSKLVLTLAVLGGAACCLGVVLLIAANWEHLGDGVKIVGLLALLGGSHALGFRLQSRTPRTAAALHAFGAGLFLAGIGLISQIFQLDGSATNALLAWLVAIAPLAVLLESPPIAWLSGLALVLAVNFAVADQTWWQLLRSPAFWPLVNATLGTVLLTTALTLDRRCPVLAAAARRWGWLLVLVNLYLAGFLRYLSDPSVLRPEAEGIPAASWGLLGIQLGLLLVQAVALGLDWRQRAQPWLTPFLPLLLLTLPLVWMQLLLLGAATPETLPLQLWLLTLLAWGLWFAVGLWMVGRGTQGRRTAQVNLGVQMIGLGLVTRFIDLIGTQMETGLALLATGLVVLLTGYGLERWRRTLLPGGPTP